MSLVDALKAGNYHYSSDVGGNVNIKTGDGNNIINVAAGNVNISTGNGDQFIAVQALNNVNIQTGLSGSDTIIASGLGAIIGTNGGDDKIQFTGSSFNIDGGDGSNIIMATGNLNDNTSQNSVTVGNGEFNQISAIANNLSISAGDTDLQSFFVGNNVGLTAGDGQHVIDFWGNNVNIALGDGNNAISTLDFAIAGGKYDAFASYLNGNTSNRTISDSLISTEEKTNVVSDKSVTKYSSLQSDIINQLSSTEKAYLDKIDLSEKLPNGQPKYIIAKGKSDGKYHIYQSTSTPTTYVTILGAGKLPKGNNYLYTSGGKIGTSQVDALATTTRTLITQDVVVDTYADINQTVIKGVQNVNITSGNGDNFLRINAQDLGIKTGDGDNDMILINEMIVDTDYSNIRNKETAQGAQKTTTTETTSQQQISLTTESGGYTTGSPLIIDFNQDGVVSAEHAKGVDVDGNGTVDGAATGGDKMLAMTDLNGNGSIDGSEVFGDQTVNPFTGEKLNAANGFEALKMVALAAKEKTGINCIDKNGKVDLKALAQALETKGIKLGFVSDENNKTVEDLSKVAYIETEGYESKQDTGAVQHNQLGTSIFEDGSKAKVDDVWFELTGLNNPF